MLLKKADTEIVELPTYYSKRGFYHVRFCCERGWELQRKEHGDYLVIGRNDTNRPMLD